MDTLRDRQVQAIERMLNFNGVDESPQNIPWKVLVFDKMGRDVISSVLRVNDLFRNSVTLHLLLTGERSPLPDVPAVYLVAPTKENITRIGKDVAAGLYQSWSINFLTPLSRPLLEHFAAETLHTSAKINQVYDQYLYFTVLESNIFSLEMPHVFRDLDNPKASESDIESVVKQVVDGLFSMLMTYGSVPIIRASRGNAAEMIAQLLDEKLRSFLSNSRQNVSATFGTNPARPVLIIMDRNIDLVSMFVHSWTYQSLINDACDFQRRRISVKNEDGTTKSYDLDPSDTFWADNLRLPFPEVADNLDAALNAYKQDAQKLTGKTDIDEIEPSAAHLKSALSALPELTARKQVIDMHMNIASVLLKAIGDRGLAQLFEAEETAGRQTKSAILENIRNKEFRDPNDKLRLYLVYYILSTKLSPADQQEIESALTEEGADLSALASVKRTKEMSKMSLVAAGQSSQAPTSHQDALFKRVTGITGKLAERLDKGGALTEGFGSVISGVKNFLPENKDLPVTRITQAIMDPTSNASLADDYLWFDPKESRGSLTRPPKRTSYDEAIIFTVGGGNYYEFGNVQDWAVKTGKKITYGSTSLPSPKAFLDECAELGRMY